MKLPGVIVLAFAERRRRETVRPSDVVPVVNVLAQQDKLRADGRALAAQVNQERVGGRATGAPFGSEQLNDHRSFSPGAGNKTHRDRDDREKQEWKRLHTA